MSELPRVCLICKHFCLDAGSPGYSEVTPGAPASIDCDMEGQKGCAWPRHGCSDASPTALRTIAEKCSMFELHADLVATPKGA